MESSRIWKLTSSVFETFVTDQVPIDFLGRVVFLFTTYDINLFGKAERRFDGEGMLTVEYRRGTFEFHLRKSIQF